MQSKCPSWEDFGLFPPYVDGGMTFLKTSSFVLGPILPFLSSPSYWHPENTAFLG